jgi:osmotically inducible protein OsmC
VPRVQRAADVTWEGNVARGSGTISAQTGAFSDLGYSLPTRTGKAEGKTSPEELLAAAHAACYAMSLANELAQAGTPVERLDVAATVTLDEVEGGAHRIVSSQLDARARGEGIEADALEQAAHSADDGCPLSVLIRASATVTVDVELEGGANGD